MSSRGFNDVTVFGPNKAKLTISDDKLLAGLDKARQRTAPPFSAERQDLMSRVGEKLLRGGAGTEASVKHFGFWICRAAIQKLAMGFHNRLPAQTRARARGLVFHLPPQNVETVFLYSWALSYLTGNSNITRLPRDLNENMQDVCSLFLEELRSIGDETQIFVHYPSTSMLGAEISKCSDARIVWGGDAKVALFSPIPLRNGGKSIWFGDRTSISIVKGEVLNQLDSEGSAALARRLFNDIFIFDQMACSSPQILYIVGDRSVHQAAVDRLLKSVAHLAHASGQDFSDRPLFAQDGGRPSSRGDRPGLCYRMAGCFVDQRSLGSIGPTGRPHRRRLSLDRLHFLNQPLGRTRVGARPDDHPFRLRA